MAIHFIQEGNVLFTVRDDLSRFGKVRGDQVTISLALPLKKFPKGTYTLQVVVIDKIADRELSATAGFDVL